MIRQAAVATFAMLPAALLAVSAIAAVDQPRDIVRLQGLDKITARVSVFDVEVGSSVGYGSLQITAEACFEALPTEPPESAAFLSVVDYPPGEQAADVFSGWMFASSPPLSALEHAVFDIWVVDCLTAAEIAEDTAVSEATAERRPPRRRPD